MEPVGITPSISRNEDVGAATTSQAAFLLPGALQLVSLYREVDLMESIDQIRSILLVFHGAQTIAEAPST